MSLFMTLINFIEAFIFPVFLSYYFDFETKLKYILYSGLLQFAILNLCSYYNQSGYILTVMIILINILSVYLKLKFLYFNHIITVIIYNFVILLTTYLGIYTYTFLLNSLQIINQNSDMVIVVCCISKLYLFISTYLLLRFRYHFDYNLQVHNWKPILLYQAILVTITVMIAQCFQFENINQTTLLILLFVLIILNFSFFTIINKINDLNQERLDVLKQLQQEQFNKETLKTIKNIKHEIQAIDHRLFYIIYEIEKLLKNNEYDKIHLILDKYKDLMVKHNMSVDTGNSVFDCLISLKINDMISNNITIKTCMFISKNNHYNDLVLINFIIDILDYLYQSHFVDIELKQTNNLLKIGFIFDHTNMNLELFEKYIIDILPRINGTYKMINDRFTELRIGLILGDYHD